jgi:exonuclease III
MTHIVTWNVNGLRAVAKKGFIDWLQNLTPDILALQEIKTTTDKVSNLISEWYTIGCALPLGGSILPSNASFIEDL